MGVDIIGFAYAATVAAGGVMGYVKAGSVTSLGAGLIFGSILGVGAYQLSQNPSNYGLMLGTTTALGGLMGYRFYNGRKFMPAGLVLCLSVGMLYKLLTKNVYANHSLPVKTGNDLNVGPSGAPFVVNYSKENNEEISETEKTAT